MAWGKDTCKAPQPEFSSWDSQVEGDLTHTSSPLTSTMPTPFFTQNKHESMSASQHPCMSGVHKPPTPQVQLQGIQYTLWLL